MGSPRLKPNLEATPEDNEGRKFYRLTDPASGRQYRLWEVEYFIAQMLDGQTPIAKVAARARDELKFELSPNDLERFVKELSALGFLADNGAPAAADEILSADDLIDDSASEIDKMTVEDELDRLVRSALLHVKQGLISQARDYFLAAKKYAPKDEKVSVMLNHLDVVGEDDGPSDIEYLWKQAVTLYPEVTQEIGPPGVGVAPIPIDQGRDDVRGGSRGTKKLLWVGGTLAFVIVGFMLVTFFGKDLMSPRPIVEVSKVRIQKITLYYSAEVQDVSPRKLWPQRFEKDGQVVDVLVKVGEAVKKGQALARMKLPAAQEKQLAGLRQKRQISEKSSLSLQSDIDKLQQEIRAKNEEAQELQEQIAKLDKTQKKELAQKKKQLATAKKDAATLKKKMAGPQKAIAKAQKQFEAAKAAETAFVQKEAAAFLRASEAGVVYRINADTNAKIDDKATAAVIGDPSALHVRFRLDDGRLRLLQKDEKVKLVYGDNITTDAFVTQSDDKGVTVEAKDSDGDLWKADRATVKLVREALEGALIAPATARITEKEAYVIKEDVAQRRAVEWVEVRGKEAIARKGLEAGELVVIGPQTALKDLKDESVKVTVTQRSIEGGQ